MRAPDPSVAAAICVDLDSSPTPYHAVETVRAHLEAAGFRPFTADNGPVGRWFHAKGGGIIAWVVAEHHDASSPLRIVGAHTDSPNLRIKPQPDVSTLGIAQLGVEVYGGALTNSWLDRDLGLAGRVVVRSGDGLQVRLVRDDRPLLRIPQLAIHLDGEFRSSGLNLNRQRHMVPMWGLGEAPAFREYLADQLSVRADEVVSWEMMAHDLSPAGLAGLDDAFLVSSRLDNQLSCFVATRSLLRLPTVLAMPCSAGALRPRRGRQREHNRAASPFLRRQIERIWASLEADLRPRSPHHRRHWYQRRRGARNPPNYVDRHEPDHRIALNGGPVLKINANQRYALMPPRRQRSNLRVGGRGADPAFRVPHRSGLWLDHRPATAGELGIGVVDAGMAQLAMHSLARPPDHSTPLVRGALGRPAASTRSRTRNGAANIRESGRSPAAQ